MTTKHKVHQNFLLHKVLEKISLLAHANTLTISRTTAIKSQSPSAENNSITGGRDLQMGLCCEASQMMFYSLKVFLTVKEKAHRE